MSFTPDRCTGCGQTWTVTEARDALVDVLRDTLVILQRTGCAHVTTEEIRRIEALVKGDAHA